MLKNIAITGLLIWSSMELAVIAVEALLLVIMIEDGKKKETKLWYPDYRYDYRSTRHKN